MNEIGCVNLFKTSGRLTISYKQSAMKRQRLLKEVSPVILIVDPLIRKSLADIFEKFSLEVVVLSHAEIDPNVQFEVVGTIEVN